jgi:hypothetical protein
MPLIAKLIQDGQMFRLQPDSWLNFKCYDDVYCEVDIVYMEIPLMMFKFALLLICKVTALW